MKSCDVFYISYDEPEADLRWEQVRAIVPHAKRIHGIKGFDAAYKACAAESSTARFFTIDGDNELLPVFSSLEADPYALPSNAVLSWSALNSVNAQAYGNGGVKNWPVETALKMNTHEVSPGGKSAVDFCFQLNYYRMPGTLSIARINASPFQAFRSGFREGVKMCLERGEKPDFSPAKPKAEIFSAHVFPENRNRLRIWCSVGSDAPNGIWAMFGARLGCRQLCLTSWNHEMIRDYEWFSDFWKNEVWPRYQGIDGWNCGLLQDSMNSLEEELNQELQIGISTLDSRSSAFFKSVYVNPAPPPGPIFPAFNPEKQSDA